VVCDITSLPFKDNVVDSTVSLHTIYHVPRSEQKNAFEELFRTLKPGGTCVTVYSWGKYSLLMNVCLFPFKLFTLFKIVADRVRRSGNSDDSEPALYFEPHNYRWFRKNVLSRFKCKMVSWRSVSVPFIKTYIHTHFFGRKILAFILSMEKKHPKLLGRIGQYPMFILTKT
jgi:ubiquinone/menaquinone biosynthesis C-methylase UbiE